MWIHCYAGSPPCHGRTWWSWTQWWYPRRHGGHWWWWESCKHAAQWWWWQRTSNMNMILFWSAVKTLGEWLDEYEWVDAVGVVVVVECWGINLYFNHYRLDLMMCSVCISVTITGTFCLFYKIFLHILKLCPSSAWAGTGGKPFRVSWGCRPIILEYSRQQQPQQQPMRVSWGCRPIYWSVVGRRQVAVEWFKKVSCLEI